MAECVGGGAVVHSRLSSCPVYAPRVGALPGDPEVSMGSLLRPAVPTGILTVHSWAPLRAVALPDFPG